MIPFMLKTIAGFEIKLTSEREEYAAHEGYHINYSTRNIAEGELKIEPNGLLNQQGLARLNAWINTELEGYPLYLENEGIDSSCFDPFAAAFYLLTRFEEYFDFEPDEYGRFEAAASLQFKYGLLELPLVNKWAEDLKEKIRKTFPDIHSEERSAEEIVTIDVDQAYAFKHRGLRRNLLSLARNVSQLRFDYLKSQVNTILFRTKDPYDNFHYLEEFQKRKDLQLIFFFNLGTYSKFDKNLNVRNRGLKRLLKRIRQFADIGIHPSYYATERPELMHAEKQSLEQLIDRKVDKSRQHFFRLLFPHTYRELLHAGIREEFTMGFASRPGFRAGCCIPFFWFDLQKNIVTDLKIYPVTYMDGALAEDLELNPQEGLEKIQSLTETIKKYKGCLISIWHNHTVNNTFKWKGWKEIFERSTGTINSGQ